MLSHYSRALVGALVAIVLLAPVAVGVEATWIGGPAGNWFEASNWSTGVVPNMASTHATIDDNTLQESVVVLDQNATIGNLVIDSGDVLNLDDSRILIASTVTLGGNLNFAPSARLQVGGSLWVQEGGALALVDTAQIVDTTRPFYLLWNEGRVEGAGQISNTSFGAVLNNAGTVSANVPGKQLRLNIYGTASRGLHFNEGELLAENGGTLNIFGLGDPPAFFTPLENANGTIEARGDSTISLAKIRLVGGTLTTTSEGGTNEGLITLGSVMFENVTLEGNLALNSVTFSNQVTNNTDIVVNSFFVEGYATITGNGSLDLNGGSVNVPGELFGGRFVGTPGFVNDVNHAIQGPGVINSPLMSTRLAFDNRGIIETAEGVLHINLRAVSQLPNSIAPTVNSGMIRAKSGGRVEILGSGSSDVLNNSSGATMGVIEAGVDSTVVLGNMTLRGGILRAVAPAEGSTAQAGKILKSGTIGPILEDVRVEGKIGDTLANSGFGLAGTIENTGVMAPGFVIYKPTTLTGGGEIHLESPSGIFGNRSTFDGFYDPLVNENNLIRGAGSIGNTLAFTNRGVVQADLPNGTLTLVDNFQTSTIDANPIINSGELKAINGGKLVIEAPVVNYEDTNLGIIHAGDGSEARVAKITGGILSTEGSGKIITTSTINQLPYLANVHNQGALVIGSSLDIQGRMTNDGAVSQTSGHRVYVGGPFTELAGSGTWGTSNIPLSFEVGTNTPSAGIFVQGAEHTLQGGGTINVARGTFVNRGTVVSSGTSPLMILLAQGATMQQHGTLIVDNGRTMEVQINDERFVNRGVISATGTFQLKRMNPGSVEFRNAPGAELHVNSIFSVLLPNSNGFMVSLWNQDGALMTGHGKVNLYRSLAHHETLFRNSGTLRPERDSSRFGEIVISGNFQQDSTGILEIDLGGSVASGDFDSVQITDGRTFLGGTLAIALPSGYDPAIGDSYEILTNTDGEVLGAFDSFTAPALLGRWWSLDYQADKVVLAVEAVTADFNMDGVVDSLDLSLWQAAYGVDAAGDADGDGDTDGRDYLVWQRQYGSGVSMVAGIAVPEPNTLAALILASAVSLALRRQFC